MKANLKTDSEDPIGTNVGSLMCDLTKKASPDRSEPQWNIYQRTLDIKKKLKKYIECNRIEKDLKVVLVCHQNYIKYHTGKWDKEPSEQDNFGEPDDMIEAENADIICDRTDYDKIE